MSDVITACQSGLSLRCIVTVDTDISRGRLENLEGCVRFSLGERQIYQFGSSVSKQG